MNVVVVSCNGLHLGFLGAYGNSWIQTPNLDRLASEGVVFDAHFPENLTTIPTRRSWWTGRYGFPDPEKGWTALRPDEEILPDLLARRGVRTALVSDVPFLREPGQGFGRGFDDVVWVRGAGYDAWIPDGDPRGGSAKIKDEPGLRLPPKDDPDYETWKDRWRQYLRNRNALGGRDEEENTTLARTVRAAIDWLGRRDASSPEPFLLWVDLFSPHGPWDPPEHYRDLYATLEPDDLDADETGDIAGEEDDDLAAEDVPVLIDVPGGMIDEVIDDAELVRLRKTYAGCVTMADRWFGELFDALKAQGRLDDTLVIFTADQGEPLGEHGYVRRPVPWLYEELVHTPLIIRLPGGEEGGMRHRGLVQSVDLFPTILSALDLPPDEEAHGFDLLPLIRGERTKVRDYACLGMDAAEFAIRTQNWYLTLPIESDDPDRGPELYRKPEDRWDQHDVIEAHAEVAEHLELLLRRFADAVLRGDSLRDLAPLRSIARFSS